PLERSSAGGRDRKSSGTPLSPAVEPHRPEAHTPAHRGPAATRPHPESRPPRSARPPGGPGGRAPGPARCPSPGCREPVTTAILKNQGPVRRGDERRNLLGRRLPNLKALVEREGVLCAG